MNDPLDARFHEEQVRAVLARAIELDAQAPLTTVDELRAIAVELGVSHSALERAWVPRLSSP